MFGVQSFFSLVENCAFVLWEDNPLKKRSQNPSESGTILAEMLYVGQLRLTVGILSFRTGFFASFWRTQRL